MSDNTPGSTDVSLTVEAVAFGRGFESKAAATNEPTGGVMTTSNAPWPAGRILGLAGLVLYIATGAFPYAASGLVAPLWGIAVLYLGWLLGLWLTIRLYQRRSAWALAMPVAALAFWWIVVTIGESAFGWTA